MGTCTVALEHGNVRVHKGDGDHVDNDWIIFAWQQSDGTSITRTYQVKDLEGHREIADGSRLATIADSLACGDGDQVTCAVTIVNLASVDDGKQRDLALGLAKYVASKLIEAYITAAGIAFGMAATLGAGGVGFAIAKAGVALLAKFEGEIQKAFAAFFDGVVAPAVTWIVEQIEALFGPPRCDGLILHEVFSFSPNTPRAERLERSYTGVQSDAGCGAPPQTDITWLLERDAARAYEPLANAHVPGLIWVRAARRVPKLGEQGFATMTNDLRWYNHHGKSVWDGPRTLGTEWQFEQVLPGVFGTLYARTSDGRLLWYRNRGFRRGIADWLPRSEVAHDWHDLHGAFCDTALDTSAKFDVTLDAPSHLAGLARPRDNTRIELERHGARDLLTGPATTDGQIIYALQRDGGLRWHAHEGAHDGTSRWAANSGKRLSPNWGDRQRVFSGGHGIIYVITTDGSLRWFRHVGYRTGDDQWLGGHQVGEGWQHMHAVFSTGAGAIYAIAPDGVLFLYQHLGWITGEVAWLDREQVGVGWREGLAVAANMVQIARIA